MKTIFHNRYTRQLVMMILAMLPAMSWAQTYISDVAVSCRPSYAAAFADLEADGYTKIEFEWNHKVDPCSIHGVIMGYKTTTDPTQAITNLIVMEGEQYKCDGTNKQMIIDGKVYRPIKAFGNVNTNGDFNSGCASTASKLYVWYTKDVTGDPQVLSGFHGVTSETALSLSTYAKLYSNGTVTANANLNKGAGGNYQYINMIKVKPERAVFKRNFTTFTNTNNVGKVFVRNYDILKYFGITPPQGQNDVSFMGIKEVYIDGVLYDDYGGTTGTNKFTWTDNTAAGKRTLYAGDVCIEKSTATGGTVKTNIPVSSSYRHRFEINYPHQNVKDIKISGYLLYNGTNYYWDLILHKDVNMYFTYPYSTTDGQLYLRNSDIFRFLGYDVSEGALSSYRPLVAQVNGVACASGTQYIEEGFGNPNGVRNVRYKDAKISIRGVNTSSTFGLIADNVPSGQEDHYGITITYPRNEPKTYALQMYVSYTYTTYPQTAAVNEEEDYKFFYVVLSPDENSASPVCFNQSSTDPAAATAPLTANVNEPLTVYTYSSANTQRTYQSQPSATSSLSDVIYSSNGINGKTFMATKPGTYTLTITQPSGDGRFGGSATRQVIVSAKASSVTGGEQVLTKPGVRVNLEELIASHTGSGKFEYSVDGTTYSSGTDYVISGNSFVATKSGKYTINVTQLADEEYEESAGTISLIVDNTHDMFTKAQTSVVNDLDISGITQKHAQDPVNELAINGGYAEVFSDGWDANARNIRLLVTSQSAYDDPIKLKTTYLNPHTSKVEKFDGYPYIPSGNMTYKRTADGNELISDVVLDEDQKFDYVLADNADLTGTYISYGPQQRTLRFNGRTCNKGVYYAMCIPFGVSESEMPEDFIFERITEQRRWNDEIDKMEIGFQQVNHLEPGVPYLCKYVGGAANKQLVLVAKTPLDGSAITMVAQPVNSSEHFQGTFINLINKDLHQETVGNPYNNGYTGTASINSLFDDFFTDLKAGRPLYALNSSNGKIEKLGANNSIRPFRAYFRFSDEEVAKGGETGAGAKLLMIRHFSIDEEEKTTTLFNLATQEQEDIVDVYDINGRKRAVRVPECEALKNLPHGIYILSNGKKISK